MRSFASRHKSVCRAPNALQPAQVLWQLFRPSISVYQTHQPLSRTCRRQSNYLAPPEEIVVPGDLAATLEAHRAKNVQSVTRLTSPQTAKDREMDEEALEEDASKDAKPKHDKGELPLWRRAFMQQQVNLTPEGKMQRFSNHELYRLKFQGRPLGRMKGWERVPWEYRHPRWKLEYASQVVQPVDSLEIDEMELPWMLELRGLPRDADGFQRLNAEISAFDYYMRPTQEERFGRTSVINLVRNLVDQCTPEEIGVEIFGSEATGLALPTSDIDFRLFARDVDPDTDKTQAPRWRTRDRLTNVLYELLGRFRVHPHFSSAVIRHSRYPLIEVTHNQSGLRCQIVCANDTSVASNQIQTYLKEYPHAYEVFTVVKSMLQSRDLIDVFRGGLGTYSIFMMLIASLRHHRREVEDPARQLLSFLTFYKALNPYETGVSVDPPVLYRKIHRDSCNLGQRPQLDQGEDPILAGQLALGAINQRLPFLLSLQDPVDPLNDLGRKAFTYKHIRETIKHIQETLASRIDSNHEGSLLAPLVGTIPEMLVQTRSQLWQYGKAFHDNPAQASDSLNTYPPGQAHIEEQIDESWGNPISLDLTHAEFSPSSARKGISARTAKLLEESGHPKLDVAKNQKRKHKKKSKARLVRYNKTAARPAKREGDSTTRAVEESPRPQSAAHSERGAETVDDSAPTTRSEPLIRYTFGT